MQRLWVWATLQWTCPPCVGPTFWADLILWCLWNTRSPDHHSRAEVSSIFEHWKLNVSTWNQYMLLQLTFLWTKQVTTTSSHKKEMQSHHLLGSKILVNSIMFTTKTNPKKIRRSTTLHFTINYRQNSSCNFSIHYCRKEGSYAINITSVMI